MQDDPEWRVALDVEKPFAEAEAAVAAAHSYDVPMIIAAQEGGAL